MNASHLSCPKKTLRQAQDKPSQKKRGLCLGIFCRWQKPLENSASLRSWISELFLPKRNLARSLNHSTGHFLDARSNSGLDPESMMHVSCTFFFALPETVLNFLLPVQKKVAKKRTFFAFLRHFCCAKPACQLRVAALLNLGAWLPPMLQESGFGLRPNK